MSSRSITPRRQNCTRLEQILVKRRQADHDRQTFWNSSDSYFRSWDFNNSQFSTWTSKEFYDNSSASLRRKREAERRLESVEARRKKLSMLLLSEAETYQKELQDMARRPRTSKTPLGDLTLANLELLRRAEDGKRRETELKQHQQWKDSQPTLKQFERRQHHEFLKRSWIAQVVEKRREREENEKEMARQLEELKQLGEEHQRKEKAREEDRKLQDQELRTFLEQQVEEMKSKELEQKKLEEEEAAVLLKQRDILDMLDHRRVIEERRKDADLRLFQKRQSHIMLRRRAEEVQRDLEADRKMLEQIAKEEEVLQLDQSCKAEQLRQEIELARTAFRKQAELEQLRAKQTEFLFEEEAKKMFKAQDLQWKQETEARGKLMQEVLSMVKQQVEEKLTENAVRREVLRNEREAMLQQMEQHKEQLAKRELTKKQDQEEFQRDLEAQVLARQLGNAYEKRKKEEEKENELRAKREETEKLMEELNRMSILGYQPRHTGRRRFRPL